MPESRDSRTILTNPKLGPSTPPHEAHTITKPYPPADSQREWFDLRPGGPKGQHGGGEVNELVASDDDVPRADRRVFPDASRDISGSCRFDDRPGIVGFGFRQEEHAIPCCRRRGK